MENHGRDEIVDLFKGFTILWVIHIHTVFWSGDLYLPDYIRELSLFIDVPIFFFLSGYLLFVGPLKTVVKRSIYQFTKLYLTYFVFTLVIFLISFCLRHLFDRSIPNFGTMLLNIATVKVDFPELRGFSWNLWFLQTYLLLIIIAPFFSIFKESFFRNTLLAVLFVTTFILLRKIAYFRLPFYVIFYAVFFFIGSVYRRMEERLTLKMFFLSSLPVIFVTMAYFYKDNYTFILQINKFPPSSRYFVYSLNFIALFVFLKSFYRHLVNKIQPTVKALLLWSSREVFKIYLMQSVVCSLPFLFIPILKDIIPAFVLYCLTLSFNLTFSILLVWMANMVATKYFVIKVKKRLFSKSQ